MNSSNRAEQALNILRAIAKNRSSDFSGTGVVFYNDLARLAHLQLTTGNEAPSIVHLDGGNTASTLALVSTIDNPFHDGFHFIDMRSLQITHLSQFISPPIPHNAAQIFHGTGARLMAAILASLLPGIEYVGIASQEGQIHLFCNGVDIAKVS